MILHLTSPKPFRMTIQGQEQEPQTAIGWQRPIEPDGSRMDGKWHLTTVGNEGAWNIDIEPLEQKPGEKPIQVYEDNAGHIFLHEEEAPFVFQVDPFLTGTTLLQDAQAIHDGNTANWSLSWVHTVAIFKIALKHPETRWIATWYPAGYVEYHERPGVAGKKFLGIDDTDDE